MSITRPLRHAKQNKKQTHRSQETNHLNILCALEVRGPWRRFRDGFFMKLGKFIYTFYSAR